MKFKSLFFAAGLAAASALALTTTARSEEARGIAVADVAAGVATVEAIDRQTRQITLKGEAESVTITAGPEVRNFDRIKKGDLVVFEYLEGLAIALEPAKRGEMARSDMVAIERAAPGEKPGIAVQQVVNVEGQVAAIDKTDRLVTLEGPNRTLTLKAADDIDLTKIAVGDAVFALYERGYAISVQPPADVDAEMLFESKSVALGVGYDWGGGTLTMRDGTRYDVKISGLSVVNVGVSKTEGSGYVYNLDNIDDLPGNYARAEAGFTMFDGASAAVLKNENGVVIRLATKDTGLQLKLAPGGMKIELAE